MSHTLRTTILWYVGAELVGIFEEIAPGNYCINLPKASKEKASWHIDTADAIVSAIDELCPVTEIQEGAVLWYESKHLAEYFQKVFEDELNHGLINPNDTFDMKWVDFGNLDLFSQLMYKYSGSIFMVPELKDRPEVPNEATMCFVWGISYSTSEGGFENTPLTTFVVTPIDINETVKSDVVGVCSHFPNVNAFALAEMDELYTEVDFRFELNSGTFFIPISLPSGLVESLGEVLFDSITFLANNILYLTVTDVDLSRIR